MVRHHGVLSSHAKVGPEVVPQVQEAAAKQLALFVINTGVIAVEERHVSTDM